MEHKSPLTVATGIIRKDGQVLITQRSSNSHTSANLWEFPGGKINYLEDPEACLIRELREETGIEISVSRLFMVRSFVYRQNEQPLHVLLVVYLCDWVCGEPTTIECQDLCWTDVHKLHSYNFTEADIAIVEQLHETERNESILKHG